MKTYEKPRLMALSLSGNDMLCGNCSPGIAGNQDLIDQLKEEWGIDLVFGSTESCAINIEKMIENIEGYCKMDFNPMVPFAS